MGKLQLLMIAFGFYGMLTTIVSFVVWTNTHNNFSDPQPDAVLGNFWKWAAIIVMIFIVIAYFAEPQVAT